MESNPDYDKYSIRDLEDVIRNINKEKYPDRYNAVRNKLAEKLGFATYKEYSEFISCEKKAILNPIEIPSFRLDFNVDAPTFFSKTIWKSFLSVILFSYIFYRLIVVDLKIFESMYIYI